MTQCKYCNKNIDYEVKLIAFQSSGEKIYRKICPECIKKEWEDYKASLQENVGADK